MTRKTATSGACLFPAALALVMRKTFRLARRPMLAAVGLGICAALLPYQLFGSAFADARLFPVVLMLVAIAVVPRPRAPFWATFVLPGLLFGLFAVRVAVDTMAFRAYDADFQRQLQLVDGRSEPPGPGRNSAGMAIFQYETRCGTVYGHTGNTAGYTAFLAGTLDGRSSVAVIMQSQATNELNRPVWKRLRAAEEAAVCAALAR